MLNVSVMNPVDAVVTSMPFDLWIVIVVLGLIFLAISILLPERGALMHGLISFVLLLYATVTSFVITSTGYITLPINETASQIVPVNLWYQIEMLPWILTILMLIALMKVVLEVLNMLIMAGKNPKLDEPGRML